jgi:hypothetical protein
MFQMPAAAAAMRVIDAGESVGHPRNDVAAYRGASGPVQYTSRKKPTVSGTL